MTAKMPILPLMILLLCSIFLVGCTFEQLMHHQVTASESMRLSVIEQALEIARLEGMSGEPEQIYVARMPVVELERRLREEEISAAARLEGRPVSEVRQEWETAGISSVPFPILEQEVDVWVVDLRGGISVIYRDHTVPQPYGAWPTATPEPFAYDNIQIILGKWGHYIGARSIVDAATSPPWGDRVTPDQMYDEAYMIDVPIQSLPTPEPKLGAPLPTDTPAVPAD